MGNIHIAIVTYNRLELTKRCLASLYACTNRPFTLCLVDNASTDGTGEFLQAFAGAHSNTRLLLLRQNMGVAVAANLAWNCPEAHKADYYLKLDNDVEILHPNWLNCLVDMLENTPSLGTIGYALLERMPRVEKPLPAQNADGQTLCQTFWEADLTNGGCVLIPKHTHNLLGFWNEEYGKYGFEDLEYGARARQAGLRVGHVAQEKYVRHLGYVDEALLDRHMELLKNSSIHSPTSGEKLYIINRFLFAEGIRPLFVQPKYLYDAATGRFRVDAASKPIHSIQQKLLEKLRYEVLDEKIALDLRALQGSIL